MARLGLHTEAEQAAAMNLAGREYHSGLGAVDARDVAGVEYAFGYLNAIHDLAVQEGAEIFAGQVAAMIEKLTRYERSSR